MGEEKKKGRKKLNGRVDLWACAQSGSVVKSKDEHEKQQESQSDSKRMNLRK